MVCDVIRTVLIRSTGGNGELALCGPESQRTGSVVKTELEVKFAINYKETPTTPEN